jgi:hypothetical protein
MAQSNNASVSTRLSRRLDAQCMDLDGPVRVFCEARKNGCLKILNDRSIIP